jgi:Leucine-rich repeat (LRR) protein
MAGIIAGIMMGGARIDAEAHIHAFDPMGLRPKPIKGRFAILMNALLPRCLYELFQKYTEKSETAPALKDEDDSVLGGLPQEKQVHLLTFLEPHDLAKLGLTNKYWNNLVSDDDVWRALAKRIHCPINEDAPVRHQVLRFIEEFKEELRKLDPPADIVAILDLKSLTIDQIHHLQTWRKARDTIVVWSELEDRVGLGGVPNGPDLENPLGYYAIFNEQFPTAQDAINTASGFGNFFVANKPILDQLTYLDLSKSKLSSIPGEIFDLAGLRELNISKCHLTELPDEMRNLTQLTKLYISENKLSSLPDWLGNFRQLDTLHANHNQLTSLPRWIGNLSLLEVLSLKNNRIELLPSEISSLARLRTLDLNSNKLKSLPDEMSGLTQLGYLLLNDNHLTSLPDWLWTFNQLQVLNLSGNQISSLSSQIGNLRALINLLLSRNRLTSVPDEVLSIPGLQTLHLGSNQLTSLPPQIFNHPFLFISIGNNPLSLRVRVEHFVRYNTDKVLAAVVGTAVICTGILSIGVYRNYEAIYRNNEAILRALASSVNRITGYIFEKVFTI